MHGRSPLERGAIVQLALATALLCYAPLFMGTPAGQWDPSDERHALIFLLIVACVGGACALGWRKERLSRRGGNLLLRGAIVLASSRGFSCLPATGSLACVLSPRRSRRVAGVRAGLRAAGR